MADITNPQAVKFCNENARTIANLIGSMYRTLDQFALNVVRDFEENTSGNVDADPIIDGSDVDGRNPVTKVNVAELKFVCEQLKATLDTNTLIALVNNWATNTQPIY